MNIISDLTDHRLETNPEIFFRLEVRGVGISYDRIRWQLRFFFPEGDEFKDDVLADVLRKVADVVEGMPPQEDNKT